MSPGNGEQDFKARVWLSDGTKFDFAEKNHGVQQNTGVCFSGGGTRSMCATMGQLRGLKHCGLIDKIDYISCVSGGSWASALYTYYKTDPNGNNDSIDDKKFLGPVVLPHDIVVNPPAEAGKNWLGYAGAERMGSTATESLVEALFEVVYSWSRDYLKKKYGRFWFLHNWKEALENIPWDQLWIAAVGKTYFQPFGLFELYNPFDPSSLRQQPFFSLDKTTVAEIKDRNPDNPDVTGATFETVRAEPEAFRRPYLVINACLLGPSKLAPYNLAGPLGPVVMEYTPLYVGSAFSPRDGSLDYRGTELRVGGGFIEPFAFGGQKSNDPPAPCGPGSDDSCVAVPTPPDPFTLVDASGTSSSAFAGIIVQNFHQLVSNLKVSWWKKALLDRLVDWLKPVEDDLRKLAPEAPYWPPTQSNDQDARRFDFGDGGVLENYGLISLMRRKVKNIVVFINTPVKLNVDYDPSDPENSEGLDGNLPPLFGYAISTKGFFSQNNQVFPKSEFAEVYKKLKNAKEAGKSVIAKCVHTIAKNDWWGIEGVELDSEGNIPLGAIITMEQQVTVLWVYNDRVKEWEDKLTQTTFNAGGDLGQITLKEAIEKGNQTDPEGPFQLFPNYKTMGQNEEYEFVELTPMQVNLLADLSCWNVTNSEEEFKTLLDG